MNVTHKAQKIAVLVAEVGFVSPLKQVAYLSIFPVEILRIGKIDHLHDARYRVIGCLDQQMNVITHKYISVKKKTALVFVSLVSLKVVAAVSFVKEDILSLIAAYDDVVKRPFKFYARFPCHNPNYHIRLIAY
jgi:hypothetical protein